MLARTTQLHHPVGTNINTPLLVPSFSSRGFVDARNPREVRKLIALSSEFITESMLLSAYDLYHELVATPRHAVSEITFVDSGGYETFRYQDLSETLLSQRTKATRREWSERLLRKVYDSWPDHIPAVFVSYDTKGAVTQQAERAQALLRRYPNHLHAFLVKPQRANQKLPVDQLERDVACLAPFQIVGVTEKELGTSFIERMLNISRIRRAMDGAGFRTTPIHVFGGLDPITVPLYFVAGAEIFDGLTWLRFGFHEGAALYRQDSAVRRYGVQVTDVQVKLLTMQHNLVALSQLTAELRRFLNVASFDEFGSNAKRVEEAFGLLRAQIPS